MFPRLCVLLNAKPSTNIQSVNPNVIVIINTENIEGSLKIKPLLNNQSGLTLLFVFARVLVAQKDA